MTDVKEQFQGKKITVLGLGLLGRGVGDVEFLAACGAEVLVTDRKSAEELAPSVERLKKYPNVTFKLGGHAIEDFLHADLILKAAGVPLLSPEIEAAKKAGIPIAMSTALFAKYARDGGARIVGVTGTRGKSTVTNMIDHSLKRANKKTILGGNIRGVSTLALLPSVQKGDIAVLELDSWQLQGFGDLKISPDVAVFTNLLPDHQNYYPDMEAYFNDKAQIFKNQKTGDALFVGPSIAEHVEKVTPPVAPVVPAPISSEWTLKIIGQHNRENASLAAAALRSLGLTEEEIKDGLESFEGVEGRLQFLREVRGVKIYNDNNATTPEATIAALRALGVSKNIVLIMGGADKGLEMKALLSEIQKVCKGIFLLSGTGTERIKKDISDAPVFDSLQKALHAAFDASEQGDVILFSPAFASFGMFKNEYERNDLFVALVKELS